MEVAGIGSLAGSLLEKGEPRLVSDPAGELLFGRPHEALAGIRGLIAVPFEIELGTPAMLIVYNDSPAHDLAPEDLEFAQLVAGVASLALRGLGAPRRRADRPGLTAGRGRRRRGCIPPDPG